MSPEVRVERAPGPGSPKPPDADAGAALVRAVLPDQPPWPSAVPTPGGELALHAESLTDEGGLVGCVACGHPELYTQKDFPRALGIAIVVIAAIAAPFTHYVSLAVAAAIDFLLHRFAPEVTRCYACEAEHRGFASEPRHPRFDIEIAERLKYGERAVMGKPMRSGGTAGAPEPEH